MLKLETQHLILIASTQDQVKLAVYAPDRFAKKLEARLTRQWPPEDFHTFVHILFAMMTSDPNQVGWWAWWILRKSETNSQESPAVIGYAGFKGQPSNEGTIEATYDLLPEFRGHAYAQEALNELMRWAFAQSKVKRIAADTTPDNPASKRTLEKCGFRHIEFESSQNKLVFLKVKVA